MCYIQSYTYTWGQGAGLRVHRFGLVRTRFLYSLIFHVWVLLDPRRSTPNTIYEFSTHFYSLRWFLSGSRRILSSWTSAWGLPQVNIVLRDIHPPPPANEYCPPGHPPAGSVKSPRQRVKMSLILYLFLICVLSPCGGCCPYFLFLSWRVRVIGLRAPWW